MGILSRLGTFFGLGSTGQGYGLQHSEPTVGLPGDTPALSIGIDGAMQLSAVWRCVTLYARALATMPMYVYRTIGEGKRVVDRDVRLHYILHEAPNPRMTAAEYWMAQAMYFMLRGNSYARIDRDNTGTGPGNPGGAVALWPMHPDRTELWILDDGTPTYRYNLPNGDVAVLAAENVLHIRDIGNGTSGMSRLDYMRQSTTESIYASAHAARTFANSGKPTGVLMTDKVLNEKQRDSIRKSFGDIATGPLTRLFVLEANMKYEPVGMTPADVQLLETRKYNIEEIGRWFGVPSPLLNAVDLNAFADVLEAWYKLDLRPILQIHEQAIMRRVLTPAQRSTFKVEFDFEALLRATIKDRYALGATGVQNGLVTRNEWRGWENLPPAPGGDILTAQVNLAPLGMLGRAPQAGGVAADPVKQ